MSTEQAEALMATMQARITNDLARRDRARNRAMKRFTDEELLTELLERNALQAGPGKITFHEPVQVATVGIGKDHTATILIHADDLSALHRGEPV